jgi:hypothetical protein
MGEPRESPPLQGTWPLYPNISPSSYSDELAAAELSGITSAVAASPEFLLLAVGGDPLIYVVTRSQNLVVATQFVPAGRMGHAVLAHGEAVLAAGEVSLFVLEEIRVVIRLNNKSGHYEPGRSCLALAAQVFQHHGFEIPDGAIEYIQ